MKERPIIMSDFSVRAISQGRKTETRRTVAKLLPLRRHSFGRISGFGKSETPGYDWTFRDSRGRWNDLTDEELISCCPYGVAGDRLWVKETWRVGAWLEDDALICVDYKADGHCDPEPRNVPKGFNELWQQSTDDARKKMGEADEYYWDKGLSPCRWRSPLFMPRWASRVTLEIVSVQVERLHDITDEGAKAEGITFNGVYWLGAEHPVKGTPKVFPTAIMAYESIWNEVNEGRGHHWDMNPWVWVVKFRKVENATE